MARNKKKQDITEEAVHEESTSGSSGASNVGSKASSRNSAASKKASARSQLAEGIQVESAAVDTAVDGAVRSSAPDSEPLTATNPAEDVVYGGVAPEMDLGVAAEVMLQDLPGVEVMEDKVEAIATESYSTAAAPEAANEPELAALYNIANEVVAQSVDSASVNDIAALSLHEPSAASTTSLAAADTQMSAQNNIAVSSKDDAESALSDYYYNESSAVTDAYNALQEYLNNKPDEYTSSYQEQIDALLEQILNREDFSYDFDADPLYQQYKNQYEHSAMLAMQDTLANAQAATGGYGSSYAVQAASGAYQSNINQLTQEMPELYQMAYSLYSDQGDTMRDNLSSLSTQEKQAQDLYQDLVDNYYTGLSAASDQYDSAYQKDYGQFSDNRTYLEELLAYYAGQEQQAFENEQTQLEYDLALKEYEESVRQFEAQLTAQQNQWWASFIAEQEAAKAAAAASLQAATTTASASSYSASSSSSSSSSSASTTSDSASFSMSDDALSLKKTITQEMRNYAAQVGVTSSDINEQAASIIASYYRNGVITQAEANSIGASYGVTF